MNSNDVPLFIIASIILLLIIYYAFGVIFYEPISNAGSLPDLSSNNNSSVESSDDSNSKTRNGSNGESTDVANSSVGSANGSVDGSVNGSVNSNVSDIAKRAMGGSDNILARGKYKSSSYDTLNSGNLPDDVGVFAVSDVTRNYTDRFEPSDEPDVNEVANVNLNMKRDSTKEKYDVNSFLPKENNKDWFETIDTVDVKNAHLINIYRPIGVNTIGQSLRNPSYDLRGNGDAICPQFVVSPWLQSTIQPDRSMKSLC